MMAMGWAVDIIKRGNASLNRINAVLANKPKSILEPNAIELDIKGDIEFRNLSFSYNTKRALSDVSLTIPIGTAMGITGATGSGKTTLFHLLARIEDPPDNSIFVDGIDVKKIKRERLRKGIIYVPQETTIFSGTIRDNISFMNPEITEAQIEDAAKVAEIYDEIMEFPGGLDARVGERGLSLSGGQRQRVALARAILLKPSVLILDDVFSSLDLKTESLVLRNLREEMRASTLLAISSRVPSISGFDSIAVFENGRLVELGNHEKLMAKSGIYHGLYKIQTFE
jgi:ATP-binding cassette subfamily B protein